MKPGRFIDFVQPKQQENKTDPKLEIFIYQPKYRDSSYLAELVGPLFRQGDFTINRTVKASASNRSDQPAPAGSAAANIDQQSDLLVFQGPPGEIEKLEKLLPRIDIAVDQVMVKAAIYEVTFSKNEGSAFQLAVSLLSSKFGISLGSATSTLDSSIRFKNGTVDAVMSALSGDARFKIISSPQLRVKSGGTAKLTIGAEVPVLGGVSYQNNGTAVRSVEYRSSGVIFNLQPQIRQNRIELTVDQQISNFSKTETGVNDSPTLTKRELSTQIAAEDGEMILLGGLQETKDSGNTAGLSFLPNFMHSSSESESKTEILMMLQLKKL